MEPAGQARVERRLAAILAADVAGYSRLIEADEEGTLGRLKALRGDLIDPKIADHKGRIVKTTGDGLLVEFASVVDALRCAAEVQAAMAESNDPSPPDRRIEFRIGINHGRHRRRGRRHLRRRRQRRGPARRAWPSRAASASRRAFRRTRLAASISLSKTWASRRSRTLRAQSGHTEWSHGGGPAMTRPGAGPPLPDKPSIAVLPFANMSGDPEQEYFADGMVEEIITALSPHPLALRHRPQFELHLQGPGGRREAGRARTWASAMCSKARCARPATGCASPRS